MEGLTPPILFLIGIVGLTGLAIVTIRFKWAMLVYGGMVMAASFAAPADSLGRPIQTWLTPVQARRSEIFAAGGLLLLAAIVFHLPQVKFSRITLIGVLFACIGFYGAFVRAVGGDMTSGAESALFAFLTIVPAVILLPSAITEKKDAINFLRVLGLVAAAWIIACAIQFVIRYKVLVASGGYTRFNGMLSNPQHAAAFLAFGVCVLTFLMLNDTKARYRPVWAAIAAVNMVLLMWTGSRTGFGMSIIGLVAVLYTRLGRSIILLPIAGIVLIAVLSVVQETRTIDLSRLTSTQDTRTRAWAVLWEEFLDRPMFGTAMAEKTTYSENSLLMALAGFGIIMGLLVGLLILWMLYKSYRIYRLRFVLHDPLEKRLADLFVGFCGMYLFGAMFEGYMISRVSSPMAFMLFGAALGSFIDLRAREQKEEEWHLQHADDPDEDGSADEYSEYSDYGGPGDTHHAPALSDSQTR